jgi:hypothetical protein
MDVNDVAGLTKSRLLQTDLTELDIDSFTRHCADAESKHVLLPTDFFSWLRAYFSRPDTFAFYRMQTRCVVCCRSPFSLTPFVPCENSPTKIPRFSRRLGDGWIGWGLKNGSIQFARVIHVT